MKAKGDGGDIASPMYNLGDMWWRTVKATNLPLCPTERDPVSLVHNAAWELGSVWKVMVNLAPTGIQTPDRPGPGEQPL